MPLRHRLPDAFVADMLGRLSTAVGAGIDLRRAWASEAGRSPARWRPALDAVAAELAGGAGLGAALAAAGAAFSPAVRGMVAVGDETGRGVEMLRDVAEALRSDIRARRELRRSLARPTFQLIAAAIVVGVLILVAGLLRDAEGRPVDLLGSGLAGPSGLGWYVVILAAVAGGMVAGARFLAARWRAGGMARRVVLLVPVVGSAVRAREAAAWCRVAGVARSAGLPAGRLTTLTALVAPGLALDTDVVEDMLRGGATLADVLHASGRFPRRLVEMVEIGEMAGTTAETLGGLAEEFDEQARRGIQAATRSAGFLVWLGVAGLIALVVFRVFSSSLGMIQDATGGL